MIDTELANIRAILKIKAKKPKRKKKKKGGEEKFDFEKELDRIGCDPEFFKEPGGGKKKKKKKRGPKVPGARQCANRDPRDMLAELIEQGIVKKLMPAHIDDMIGEPNLLRLKQEQVQKEFSPDPSMWDLRQTIVEQVCMPLGSKYVKTRLEKMNYYLFFGPHGSGKVALFGLS